MEKTQKEFKARPHGGLLSVARLLLVAATGLAVCGCSASSIVLPDQRSFVESPFDDYDEAWTAFDEIAVQHTTFGQLLESGFDVSTLPNVKSLSYIDLIERFLPHNSITFADLDPALRACFEAGVLCRGYQLTPSNIAHERVGSVMLDMLNFRRTEVKTGWEADAVFVLHDDVVVYKLWSGTQRLNETRQMTNPLGPFQNMGGAFTGVVRSAMK